MNRTGCKEPGSPLVLATLIVASLGIASSCGPRSPKDLEGHATSEDASNTVGTRATRRASDTGSKDSRNGGDQGAAGHPVGGGNPGSSPATSHPTDPGLPLDTDAIEAAPIDTGRSESIREENFLHFVPAPPTSSSLTPARRKSFVLHARELEAVFVRFFGDAVRFSITTEIFDVNARNALGTPSFVGDSPAAFVRTARAETVGFDYVRALRSFAGPACDRLVTKERAAGVVAGNKILVAAGAPTAAQVSGMMNSMFGFRPAAGVHEGASAYATLFASVVAARGSTPAVVDEQYKLLCVALATDARVFLR